MPLGSAASCGSTRYGNASGPHRNTPSISSSSTPSRTRSMMSPSMASGAGVARCRNSAAVSLPTDLMFAPAVSRGTSSPKKLGSFSSSRSGSRCSAVSSASCFNSNRALARKRASVLSIIVVMASVSLWGGPKSAPHDRHLLLQGLGVFVEFRNLLLQLLFERRDAFARELHRLLHDGAVDDAAAAHRTGRSTPSAALRAELAHHRLQRTLLLHDGGDEAAPARLLRRPPTPRMGIQHRADPE